MIEIMEALITILRERGIKESSVVAGTGINKTTIHEIYTGVNDNPKVQTITEIADYAGIRLVWETEKSKKAIDTGDISAYREMMANRDKHIDSLMDVIASQRRSLDKKDDIIAAMQKEISRLVRGEK